jgi:hypothetical protein
MLFPFFLLSPFSISYTLMQYINKLEEYDGRYFPKNIYSGEDRFFFGDEIMNRLFWLLRGGRIITAEGPPDRFRPIYRWPK